MSIIISIIMISSTIFLTALVQLVQGSILPRDSINHDAVVGFSETVPSGTTGDVYLAYQPFLYVEDGCVPFPAVDAEGNTGYVPPRCTVDQTANELTNTVPV